MAHDTPDDAPDEALAEVLAGRRLLRLGSVRGLDLPVVAGAGVYCATSGSTGGTPSVVALGPATIAHAVAATDERLGGPGAWLLSLPDDHVAGLMVRARALTAGAPLVRGHAGAFTAAGFARDVALLHDATPPGLRRYGSLVPTQLHRVLEDAGAATAAASLDAVLLGGAAAPEPLLARARAARVPVVTTYGMTETAGGCVYDGVPLRGTSVAIDDDGRIRLRGDQVALGYVTARGLEPFDGEVLTNDRGRWEQTAGGRRLRVLGRRDDVIVSGGVNVDPHAVEAAALAVEGVAEAAAVGVPDPEWGQLVCLALRVDPGTAAGVAEDVRGAIRDRLGAASVPKRVLAGEDSLPLRGPGKIDRRALVARFAQTDASGTPRAGHHPATGGED